MYERGTHSLQSGLQCLGLARHTRHAPRRSCSAIGPVKRTKDGCSHLKSKDGKATSRAKMAMPPENDQLRWFGFVWFDQIGLARDLTLREGAWGAAPLWYGWANGMLRLTQGGIACSAAHIERSGFLNHQSFLAWRCHAFAWRWASWWCCWQPCAVPHFAAGS